MMAFLVDSYVEEEVPNAKGGTDTRVVLKLDPRLSPFKVAVLPLLRKDGHPELARTVYESLRRHFKAEYDDGGAIGRRYRRQDEIGTPYCVTIDHETLEDGTVTLRDRDTLEQERVAIDGLADDLAARLAREWRSPKVAAQA
jgi:glycyl-tRNA synthetase